MLSLRLLARLSVLVLLIVAGVVLLGAGCGRGAPPAGFERTQATAAAPDGPEQVWVERQKVLCNDTLSYSYFGWVSAIDVDQAIVGAYRADKDRGAGYV